MTNYDIPGVKTFEYTKLVGLEQMEFGEKIIIDDFVFLYAKKKIWLGNYIHLGSFTSVTGGGELEMQDFTGTSSGVRIVTGSDDFSGGCLAGPTVADEFRNVTTGKVTFERFAFAGANAVVLPGVTIGEGATLGANSVASRDLEPRGVYVGNRRIGWRDREGSLETYRRFLETPESVRDGPIFR